MIEQGVYMPCSQFEALFISRTYTEAIIEETIDAAKKCLVNLMVFARTAIQAGADCDAIEFISLGEITVNLPVF